MGKVNLELDFERWEGLRKVRKVEAVPGRGWQKSPGIFKGQWVSTGGVCGQEVVSYLKDECWTHAQKAGNRTRMPDVPAMPHILEFPAQDINMRKHETRIGIIRTAT